MLIHTRNLDDGLAVVSLSGRLGYASALKSLTKIVAELDAKGRRGVLLDHGKVERINMANLAALIELVARHPHMDFGCCALPGAMLKVLRKSGLDRGLHIYDTVEAACADPRFRSRSLTGTRAVVLCADANRRAAPLTDARAVPMLDLAGKTALERITDHLGRFGLRDVILNPGHMGHQVIDHVRAGAHPDLRVFFANEGRGTAQDWHADPLGSASTLRRLHRDHAAFAGDVVVMEGDTVADLDLAAMMQQHRDSGADATVATLPAGSEAPGRGRFATGPGGIVTDLRAPDAPSGAGIYIFRPGVFDLLSDLPGLDIVTDLLPAVLASGGVVKTHDAPFAHAALGCGRDYARAVRLALGGASEALRPAGREVRPGVWAAEGAWISPRAQIEGPCHVGAGARIEARARLEGACSVGAGAVIDGRTVLRDTIVLPQTHVGAGVWADGMILHGDWAVSHPDADGRARTRQPMEGVGFVQATVTEGRKSA